MTTDPVVFLESQCIPGHRQVRRSPERRSYRGRTAGKHINSRSESYIYFRGVGLRTMDLDVATVTSINGRRKRGTRRPMWAIPTSFTTNTKAPAAEILLPAVEFWLLKHRVVALTSYWQTVR